MSVVVSETEPHVDGVGTEISGVSAKQLRKATWSFAHRKTRLPHDGVLRSFVL